MPDVIKNGRIIDYTENYKNSKKDRALFAAPEVVLRACYMSGLSFSGFTEVYKPSLLKHYVEAIGKYC